MQQVKFAVKVTADEDVAQAAVANGRPTEVVGRTGDQMLRAGPIMDEEND